MELVDEIKIRRVDFSCLPEIKWIVIKLRISLMATNFTTHERTMPEIE